jgi:hypothetical protein
MKKYILLIAIFLISSAAFSQNPVFLEIKKELQKEVISKADLALKEMPITVTAAHSSRSAGGLHDYFSEGDYWWPNPNDLNGAYIQKDGLSNPDNFVKHRQELIRFSQIMGTLSSAYLITGDEKFVKRAFLHLNAWFVDTATLMNPSLLYSQAIKGKATGRSIGVIDMIQMMEVAQSIMVMEKAKTVNQKQLSTIKEWFSNYLKWVTTHPYGVEERDAKNNHGTCWVMQVAVFAKLVKDQTLMNECRTRFKNILLPNQMDKDGSFPLELKRTKPFGYSLFNLDAMVTICNTLSTNEDDLWNFKLDDGRTLKNAVEFMVPFVEDKNRWSFPHDVMYWNEWPVAQPFLVLAYSKYLNKSWLNTWKRLEHFPQTEEIIRNLPVRNPLIWLKD